MGRPSPTASPSTVIDEAFAAHADTASIKVAVFPDGSVA